MVLGYSHFGMLAAARWIKQQLRPRVGARGQRGSGRGDGRRLRGPMMGRDLRRCCRSFRSTLRQPEPPAPALRRPPPHRPPRHAPPQLEAALGDNPGFRLRIIGHSLGGGTAALLTMMLREAGAVRWVRCEGLGAV